MTESRTVLSSGPACVVTPEVDRVLAGVRVLLQPVVTVATGATFAMEALARFTHAPDTRAEAIFAAAHRRGYGHQLEAACVRAALDRRAELPDGVRLAINVSPGVLHHPTLVRQWDRDLDGIIVEVTEHRADRPDALVAEFRRLRGRGALIAVDDVGTGYAGLLRLATTRPDVVKIDRTVVTGARTSDAQSAVLETLVSFSHRLGAQVIGEGVESMADLAALADFDVDHGQGWAIGAPTAQLEPVRAEVGPACQRARAAMLARVTTSNGPDDGLPAATSTLTAATTFADLHAAVARAATELGVDLIGVSVAGPDGLLREITSSDVIDTAHYVVSEFPTTRAVLESGVTAEVQLDDPAADPAEQALLRERGLTSLLMVPLLIDRRAVGVVELSQRVLRRWSGSDLAQARRLVEHLAQALLRIDS